MAKQYGYEKLNFCQGDISGYTGGEPVDMVVSLHACDTATDYAIAKAVEWKARVIFAVPCCQHEVNGQISNELWEPVLKYGILKERISALLTDGIRANLLEEAGYDTQVLEFIDMEHTPKNLLIRAVRRMPAGDLRDEARQEKEICKKAARHTGVGQLAREMQVEMTLQKLLSQKEE